MMKALIVAGARPNFMKVAPLLHAIERHNVGANGNRIDTRLVHTGQHYDAAMSEVFFRELEIRPPDINLGVGSGSHTAQTAKIMTGFEEVCANERPDWVVVVGDVNSTLACTLVAAKMGIRLAHVEAGLRSYDRTMPEEINRIVTDSLGDLLLTPSQDASENLQREGVPESRIELVGNIMIDTLLAQHPEAEKSELPQKLGLTKSNFVYVTLHRPSNVDDSDSLCAIMGELRALASEMPVIFPMHPRTRTRCEQFGISLAASPGPQILEPIGFRDSLALTEKARFVLTDSGGLQEESTFFRTPCLTLRPNTERPVTLTLGSNRLTSLQSLASDIEELLQKDERLGEVPPLWDGQTAQRIVACLAPNA